jgi:hypothetical protein
MRKSLKAVLAATAAAAFATTAYAGGGFGATGQYYGQQQFTGYGQTGQFYGAQQPQLTRQQDDPRSQHPPGSGPARFGGDMGLIERQQALGYTQQPRGATYYGQWTQPGQQFYQQHGWQAGTQFGAPGYATGQMGQARQQQLYGQQYYGATGQWPQQQRWQQPGVQYHGQWQQPGVQYHGQWQQPGVQAWGQQHPHWTQRGPQTVPGTGPARAPGMAPAPTAQPGWQQQPGWGYGATVPQSQWQQHGQWTR